MSQEPMSLRLSKAIEHARRQGHTIARIVMTWKALRELSGGLTQQAPSVSTFHGIPIVTTSHSFSPPWRLETTSGLFVMEPPTPIEQVHSQAPAEVDSKEHAQMTDTPAWGMF